jgi:hypothetical protein
MKNVLGILVALLMVIALIACGDDSSPTIDGGIADAAGEQQQEASVDNDGASPDAGDVGDAKLPDGSADLAADGPVTD